MIIYRLLCSATGKSYIGMTTKTMGHRLNGHKARARSGWKGKLYSAMRKHGAESFTATIVATADSWEQMIALEIHYIKEFDSFAHGYNMTEGGEGKLGWIPDEAWRAAVSRRTKGVKLSDERRAQISECTKGSKNPRYGTKWTPELRQKITEAKAANPYTHAPWTEERKLKASLSVRQRRAQAGAKIEFQGESLILQEWSRRLGIGRDTLAQRLRNGWGVEKAFTVPVGERKGKWRGLLERCKHGHEFSAENTIVTPKGRRCRTCKLHNETLRRARVKAEKIKNGKVYQPYTYRVRKKAV